MDCWQLAISAGTGTRANTQDSSCLTDRRPVTELLYVLCAAPTAQAGAPVVLQGCRAPAVGRGWATCGSAACCSLLTCIAAAAPQTPVLWSRLQYSNQAGRLLDFEDLLNQLLLNAHCELSQVIITNDALPAGIPVRAPSCSSVSARTSWTPSCSATTSSCRSSMMSTTTPRSSCRRRS